MPTTYKAHEAPKKQNQHMPWACSKCTFINVASARHCETCYAPRPGGGPVPEAVIETAAPEPEPTFAASTLGAKQAKFRIFSPMSALFPGPSNLGRNRVGQRLPPIQGVAVTTPEEDGMWPRAPGAAEPFPSCAGGHGRGAVRSAPDVGRRPGAPTQSPPIWGSFERNTGTWTPYSATETAAIEDAFVRGHPSINLPTCFNATVHFNRFGGHHHQTTPAIGSKPEGYRSVLRGTAGMKATLHWNGSMWRLELPNFHTGHEQQVEIYAAPMITEHQALILYKALEEAKKREESAKIREAQLVEEVKVAKAKAIHDFQSQQAAQALQDERRFGRVVAMAPVSQYTADEGKSACTTIACFGALEMLQRLRTFGVGLVAQPGGFALSPPHLNSAELADALVRVVKQGVDAHVRALSHNPASQHRSSSEVMDALPATHELRQKLFRGTCTEYLLSGSEDERAACFMQALQPPAAPHTAASYVLTKPPETVLCVIGADASTPCFLLDSHPNSSRRLAGAHALRFDCVQSLCTALCRRFPVVHLPDVDPGDWQLAYMRQFSAMPLMLTVPLTDNERNSMQCQCMQDGELMVDPVVAMDGHTYEREYILRHFEAERERIAATHQPAHGDDACCGHVQVRHTINSPQGGQILVELLVPNRFALTAIQQAVEGGRIGDGEVCDWRERREAVVRQGGQGGQGEAILERLARTPERPRSHLKEGFLIICNRRTDAPRRYLVLFQDRLSWYRDDSKNEPLGQFRFRPHTEVLLTRDQLTLTTPSSDQWDGSLPAEKADKIVLRADNASAELQEWQDAIREQLRQYAAMSYAPRAEDARILENGLAIGLCTEAELKFGRDTAIRTHCECCGQTAPPPFAPRQCKRCARVLCVACVPHSAFSFEEAVIDNESVTEPQCNHPICMECFEDAANRLRRTVVDESERHYLQLLNEKLQPWEQQQTTLAKAQVKQRLEAEHTLLEEQLNATHAADMAALRTRIAKAEEETRARQLDVERAQVAAQAAEGGAPPPPPAPQPAPPPSAAAAARVADVLNGEDMDDDLRAIIAFSLETAAAEEELRQALAQSAGERGRPTLHHVPFQARFRWLRQQVPRLMGRRAPADGGALPRAGGAPSGTLHPEEDDAMMEAQLAAFRAEEEERVAMLPAPRHPPHGTPQPPVERDWLHGPFQAFHHRDFLGQRGGSLGADPRSAPGGRELAMGLVFPTEFALERLERRDRECRLYESEVCARLEEAARGTAEQRSRERGRLETDLLRLQGAAEAAMREAEAARQRERAAREEQARREEQRRQEEQARLRREREEAERQKREREAQEQADLRAMQEHNAENRRLGVGDFRMCKKCRAGPVTNDRCSNLQTHNNEVAGGANRCRNCGWFTANWHEWPMWDGKYGPH